MAQMGKILVLVACSLALVGWAVSLGGVAKATDVRKELYNMLKGSRYEMKNTCARDYQWQWVRTSIRKRARFSTKAQPLWACGYARCVDFTLSLKRSHGWRQSRRQDWAAVASCTQRQELPPRRYLTCHLPGSAV